VGDGGVAGRGLAGIRVLGGAEVTVDVEVAVGAGVSVGVEVAVGVWVDVGRVAVTIALMGCTIAGRVSTGCMVGAQPAPMVKTRATEQTI